jgi:hypothetical protein
VALEDNVAFGIVRLFLGAFMNRPVDFDGQSVFGAVEIDDEPGDDLLSPEFQV